MAGLLVSRSGICEGVREKFAPGETRIRFCPLSSIYLYAWG